MAALTADRVIEGDGTPEADWLAWEGLATRPVRPLDAWLGSERRLVVVAPHPDDEILAGGALAALHAQRGGAVRVIAVTDGEASHRGAPGWDPGALADIRRRESAAGLESLLGRLPELTRLGFPDGAVATESTSLAAALGAVLAPDDLVVTTWRLDGHPDHEACASATAQACERVGCALIEAPVWMWHWAAPGDPRVPWGRLGGLAVPVDVVASRRAALAAHLSQLTPRSVDEGPVLTPAILARLARATDHYFV